MANSSDNQSSSGRSSSNMPFENPRKRALGFTRGRGTAKRSRGFTPSPSKHSLPREENDTLRLTEKDLGITEYINNFPGFNGVIKQRFSDFLVNELKPDGTEVHLTDKKLPPPVEDFKPSLEEISDVLPQQTWDQITALLSQPSGSVEILVTERTKEERRFIHQIVKKVYGQALDSNTSENNGNKYITVSRPSKDGPRRRDPWPDKRSEYVHFALYKENMDTMEAVNLLAHKLFMKPNLLTYAGTKDRRAKTCQRICIKRIDPAKVSSAAKALRGISVSNFEFCTHALQLGQLAGNRFQIVLRNVTGTEEQIEGAMTSLKENGFLNYYGLQRFGTQSVPTHHIGRALLQGDWQQAVELILKPRGPGENPNLQEMRQLWWKTRDAGQAFKVLHSRDKCIEGQLLQGLMKNHKNDIVNALEFIPRNTRLMYLHSYQSFIWNLVLSRRIQEFGLKPVAGDLVLADDAALLDTVEVEGQTEEPDAAPEKEKGSSAVPAPASNLPKVRALSAEEAGRFSLHDLVLPLPGYEVTYPGHAAAQWYEELMAKDGLSSAALKLNIRKYTLGGTYRKMAVLPSKVSWKVLNYSDATKPLIQSDLDIVQNRAPVESEPNGAYKALVLDFCLPSSVYATMALREVLKCDTSARHQTTLNSYSPAVSNPPVGTPAAAEESVEKQPLEKSVKAEDSEKTADVMEVDTPSENKSEDSKVKTTTEVKSNDTEKKVPDAAEVTPEKEVEVKVK